MHVGVNLEVELLPVPEVLRQVASLAGAGRFLPGYAHFPDLQDSSARVSEAKIWFEALKFGAETCTSRTCKVVG
jgi:hypothetical protein